MSTDQRAPERVGELIQNAFNLLLQVNTGLEMLQFLTGSGTDLNQLLAPHSQTTWEFLVPQEKRFRENWGKFISAMEGASLSTGPKIQRVEVEAVTVYRAPAPLLAIAASVPEKAISVIQVENVPEPEPEPQRQTPTHPASATPTPTAVTIKEEPKQPQPLPPAGSVDNPMEIEESDDGGVVRHSVAGAKRKMKAPPPDEGTPIKRSKPASIRPSSSKGPGPVATPETQTVSEVAKCMAKLKSCSAKYSWKPHKNADVESYGKDRKLLHERLDQLGPPLHVDRSKITHDRFIVTRADITSIYGGENISSFPRIGKEGKGRHPYRNFLHGNFDHNPFLPPEPGWPGLFFRLDEKNDHQDVDGNQIVYRTFARHPDRRCVYLGQYTLTHLEDISKQEWRDLPDKTKTIWLKFFGSTLLANRSLARIALRVSQGKEPTEAQVLEKYESLRTKTLRKPLAEKLQSEIRKAFNRGEERIVVWGMKCVSYDYGFEVDLATKWQELNNTARKQAGSRTRKRRPSTPDDSEGGDEDEAPTIRSRLSRKTKPPTLSPPISSEETESSWTFTSVGSSGDEYSPQVDERCE